MTGQELLTELRNNVLRDSSSLVSGGDDRLWSDDQLIAYLNDAIRRFARLTGIVRDATTSAVTEVALQTGVSNYTLDTRVLAVLSARYHTDAGDLPVSSHSRFADRMPVDTTFWDVSQATTLSPGRPQLVSFDEQLLGGADTAITMRVEPAPSATENGLLIRLRVMRAVFEDLTADNLETVTPEVPADYHLDLLEWAAYRAYRNKDVDGEDGKRAVECAERFARAVTEAKQDMRRRSYAGMGWRFGGVFSWR